MTNFSFVPTCLPACRQAGRQNLISLENSRFSAVLDEGMTLALGSLPLRALSLRVLPTLDSESKKIIARIYGKTQVIWPSCLLQVGAATCATSFRIVARESSRIHALLQGIMING